MIKRFVVALFAGGLAFGAAACNTVEGAGQDIESVAQEVDEEL